MIEPRPGQIWREIIGNDLMVVSVQKGRVRYRYMERTFSDEDSYELSMRIFVENFALIHDTLDLKDWLEIL